jgi:glycosyltransferase involved in cell wall biosynthesis
VVERWRNGRRFVVAYVGVMGRQEGIPYLLDAAHHIVVGRGRDDVQFCLVGGGTELEALRARSLELGLGEVVTFTGRVPDEILLEVLNTADVCVNCDPQDPMNDISTMNKIMEYMALGKPVVQFDLTEGRVSAQGASLYARPNDARDLGEKILVLLDAPDLRARMGALGRSRIENELEWRFEAPKLLAAYETLFQSEVRSGPRTEPGGDGRDAARSRKDGYP